MRIVVNPGVYQTSGDSDLMVESVEISKNETFLEIGCGTGVVSIAVAGRAKSGIGVVSTKKPLGTVNRTTRYRGSKCRVSKIKCI